jgi:hypothetical protein
LQAVLEIDSGGTTTGPFAFVNKNAAAVDAELPTKKAIFRVESRLTRATGATLSAV